MATPSTKQHAQSDSAAEAVLRTASLAFPARGYSFTATDRDAYIVGGKQLGCVSLCHRDLWYSIYRVMGTTQSAGVAPAHNQAHIAHDSPLQCCSTVCLSRAIHCPIASRIHVTQILQIADTNLVCACSDAKGAHHSHTPLLHASIGSSGTPASLQAVAQLPLHVWDAGTCLVPPAKEFRRGGILVVGGRGDTSSGFSHAAHLVSLDASAQHTCQTLKLRCAITVVHIVWHTDTSGISMLVLHNICLCAAHSRQH